MKAHLLHPSEDVDWGTPVAPDGSLEADVLQDLHLGDLCAAMASGDPLIDDVARRILLGSAADRRVVQYRQAVLSDCIAHADLARELYAIATDAVASEKQVWSFLRTSPSGSLHRSVEVLEIFVTVLRRLRATVDAHADEVRSEGLVRLFDQVRDELDDTFFDAVHDHLDRLRFRDGVLLGAALGPGNRGWRYVLRTPDTRRRGWRARVGLGPRSSLGFEVPPRDEAGQQAVGALRDRGIALVADALSRSTQHILDFFTMLRAELAFYVGCVQLREVLVERGQPICMPELAPSRTVQCSARGLYDVCLAVRTSAQVVGNTVHGDGASLIMVTGANSGGKSTFLRSLGVAQLMAECGMFVGAEAFTSSAARRVFTHFIREEDEELASGRLEEELARMSRIADAVQPGSLVLVNEAFMSTNEAEGSEIGRQVVRAFVEAGVRVVFVTHLYDLASGLAGDPHVHALFLRADPDHPGRRAFELAPGAPLSTSFGPQLFDRLGAWGAAPAHVPASGAPEGGL